MQRTSTRRPREAPASAQQLLARSGKPLDESARRVLEPRFGHDFSTVRVHDDSAAANATADVHARAWTVGEHIAFAPGAYAPRTFDGMKLLAHELAHVTQQAGSGTSAQLTVGEPNDTAEHEADRVASSVTQGENATSAIRDRATVRGQFENDYDPWPEKTEAARIRAEMPQYLEWRGTHPAGFELSKEETGTAEKATGTAAPKSAAPAAGLNPTFVLHDTDSSMKMTHFEKQKGLTGPKGKGVMAWIPMQEKKTAWNPKLKKMETTTTDFDPVVTRPEFFESKRPTTTGFEKGDDILGEGAREAHFHKIWQAAASAERDPALDRALDGTGLSDDDKKELKKSTNAFLIGGGAPTVDGTKTTAGWAVAEICKRVSDAGADAIADPDAKKHAAAVKTLEASCGDAKFEKWLESRSRVGERTNVEIAQVGEGKPLPKVPYSTAQYEGVAKIYLMAALAAKRWPSISTHKWEDRDIIGGHDDPRCFNLTNLYTVIATKMSHPAATIYGLEPRYGGPADELANIAWTKTMCHADPPA